jgi:hypothetical protein
VEYFAIWSVMTQINGHASALREAYDSGIDPHTVELNNETAARGKKKTKGNYGRCLSGISSVGSILQLSLDILIRLPIASF